MPQKDSSQGDTENNMATGKIIRLNSTLPSCPLCRDNKNALEHLMEREYVIQRNMFVYKCDTFRVAIAVDDPMVGKWDAALAKSGAVECPNCNADMRFFATSIGFMKCVCPKKSCGATLSNSEPDRLEKAKGMLQ